MMEQAAEETPYTFNRLYDGICSRIRQSGELNTLMAEFQELKNDYERVTFVYDSENWDRLAAAHPAPTGKNTKEALDLEAAYEDYLAESADDGRARKALDAISRSIQLTVSEDTNALNRRFTKRGWAALLLNRFPSAKKDAEHSLFQGRNESAWLAYEIQGHCWHHSGDVESAEESFKKALQHLRQSTASNAIRAKAAGRIALALKKVQKRAANASKQRSNSLDRGPAPPSVSHGTHPVLSHATSSVEISYHENCGRGLYASKDILPGDIVIVDEASAAFISPSASSSHCTYCMRRVDAPLPCTDCSLVWFCDLKCRDVSNHKNECSVLSLLHDDSLGKMGPLVFRILSQQTWVKLTSMKKYLMANVVKDAEVSFLDKWNVNYPYVSTDYLTTFYLITNANKRSFGDLFKRTIGAIFITHVLEKSNFFGNSIPDREDFLYVACLGLRHLQGASCNAYEMTELRLNKDEKIGENAVIGGAVYTTISLTNHSCWPNTIRYCVGSTCVLRATRTIRKGEQVYDNYGHPFYSTNFAQRRAILSNQYKFECQCEACLQNWPIFSHRQEKFVFSCPNPVCGKSVAFIKGQKESCSLCGEESRYSKLLKKIGKEMDTYEKALQMVKKGNAINAMPILIKHQMFVEKCGSPPTKHLTELTRLLHHCFSFLGNVYIQS